MHILIPVLHRPTKPTGVCRHAANLAKCLAKQNNVTAVTVVTGTWQRDYFEDTFGLADEKINLIGVDIKNSSVSRNLWFLFGLPKLVSRVKPTLVHISFPFPFIRQRFDCPVVSTLHDLYPYECPENFGFPQVWFNRMFLDQCIRNSDGIACVSAVTLQVLEQYFGNVTKRKNKAVVYNYVDFSDVLPSWPHQFGSDTQDQKTGFLMSVAQHRKNKNLDLLIQAFAQLRQTGKLVTETQLVIVGSPGPETENLKSLIERLELTGKVKMLSSISDGELCWLYQKTQLFVIPSSTEGFCIPLVEALSLGAKAVCSDIPIFREVGSANHCQFFDLTMEETETHSKANQAGVDNNRISKTEEKNIQNLAAAMTIAIETAVESPLVLAGSNYSAKAATTANWQNSEVSRSTDQRFTQTTVAEAYLTFYQALV